MVAVVGALATVITAVLARQSKSLKAVRDQVENSHIDESGQPYNLRDNIDENQAEVLNALGRVERELVGMKKDIGRLDDRDLAHGKHHERVDGKLDQLDTKLDTHLEQTREHVDRIDALERKDNTWKSLSR